jgi:hypothetical protein
MHGAGLRQRQARREATLFGGIIDGNQHLGIAAFAGNDEESFFTSPRKRGEVARRSKAEAGG